MQDDLKELLNGLLYRTVAIQLAVNMNNVYEVTDCCRACLRSAIALTPTTTMDNDSIKLCDKLFCCVAEIVSVNRCSAHAAVFFVLELG